MIFRAKKLKANGVSRTEASYHATFNLKMFQQYARAICGKLLFVDWETKFVIVSYDEIQEETGAVKFEVETRNKGLVKFDITNEFCHKCKDMLKKDYQAP